MSRRPTKKSIALAVSAALAASPLAQAGTATENSSLLGASTLDSGYMQFAKARRDSEGKCGEGKCGDAKADEGKCGEGKCGDAKADEGKCGEGKCGDAKADESKCGEGKCGGA